jgi:hypothetical protein
LIGLFPAAQQLGIPSTIVSHPGVTYGGLVHDGRLLGQRMIDALSAVAHHFRTRGFALLRYKPLPAIYQLIPAQDDLYALFRLGARRVRCDLSSTIDLSQRRTPAERRRRALKKALKCVVVAMDEDSHRLEQLWPVVEENLARKHETRPVHSFVEIAELARLFPKAIRVVVGLVEGKVEAGLILFITPRVWHAQYIASSKRGYDCSALDAIFDFSLQHAVAAGARYFDFGTSNECEGHTLNDGLYRFKSEFGGGGSAYETYELDLSAS